MSGRLLVIEVGGRYAAVASLSALTCLLTLSS